MNQRNQVVIEIVKNERNFAFCIPFGCSYDDVLQVAQSFLDQANAMKEAADKAEQLKAEQSAQPQE